MNGVIFDMENKNVLVSLAYIKANDNPLYVFCNYVLYALFKSPNQSLRSDEVIDVIYSEFGLRLPQHMVNNCISILVKNGEVVLLPAGAGYAVGTTQFNITAFECTLRRLHEQENTVLESLIAFVGKRYKQHWTVEQAKNHLSHFLNEEGYAAQIFLHEELVLPSKTISPSFYIGRYVTSMQQSDCLEKKYLEDIINGMMIFQGVYQTNDYQQNKNQKFKDTVFYFDTNLILRALGYSWNAQVQATQELIQLITEKYEAKIGIFDTTLAEVENALLRAGKAWKHGAEIFDDELRIYAELNPVGASLMEDASSTVLNRLQQEFKIVQPPVIDWNNPSVRRNVIDVEEITNYIVEERHWRSRVVHNDVDNINYINVLRGGNYRIRYGGRERLPVFVTSNKNLVHTFKKYISEKQGASMGWDVHALPVVTDDMILFRLWVPFANEYSKLPSLTLSRYAYAAQNEETPFFEKLRDLANKYKDEHGIDTLNLSEVRRHKLEDILIQNSNGDADQMTIELVATSIDELIKLENISLHNTIDDLQESLVSKADEIATQNSRIIELAAQPFVNKIGWRRIIIIAAKYWWVISAAAVYVFTTILNQYISVSGSTRWIATVAVPVAIQTFLFVLDKFCDDKDLRHFFIQTAITYVWRWYSRKICTKISDKELPYKEAIVAHCLDHTPIFARYKNYCIGDDSTNC